MDRPHKNTGKSAQRALRLFAYGMLMCVSGSAYSEEAADVFQLQILHANDLEGGVTALERAPIFGALVEFFEKSEPNTVVLSGGDNYIPGPFYNAAGDQAVFRDGGLFNEIYNAHFGVGGYNSLRESGGRVDVSIMNLIGFDASAVGNHEFDNGTEAFQQVIIGDFRDPAGPAGDRWVGAQFPYLTANLDFSGDAQLGPLFTDEILPSTEFVSGPAESTAEVARKKLARATVVEVNGERIGVIGATTQLLESISSNGGVRVAGNPGANDMAQLAGILQPIIDEMTTGEEALNKIILVTHLQQIALEKELLRLLSGVDVIIAGGSDTLQANADDALNPGDTAGEPYPYVGKNRDGETGIVVSTDGQYSYLGRLLVQFDGAGKITEFDEEQSGPYATANPATLAGLDIKDANGDATIDYTDLKAVTTVDEAIQKLVEGVFEIIIAKDGVIFGETRVFLEGRRDFVRTEETNLGNLTADANLWQARLVDPATVVSLKNGGGIRAAIGEARETSPGSGQFETVPPLANPLSGKWVGQISQLDIENSLRFNNTLTLLTVTIEELVTVLEHGVAATGAGQTPGQFPQVAGMRFSYDAARPAGERVRFAEIEEAEGPVVIVKDGRIVGEPGREIRIVTLGFLAGGGDNYPFNRETMQPLDLDTLKVHRPDAATFSGFGTEQDALAEYLQAFYPDSARAYDIAETPVEEDRRISPITPTP